MTENEAINELQANIDLPFGFTVSDEVSKIAIKALEEIQQYRAIGTIGEIKDRLGEHEEQHREIRAKAIDDAIEVATKAICIGCGYLDGHNCTYKGGNCGVSKPMLETVVKALEQIKAGGKNE